jgi:hypothetical protein
MVFELTSETFFYQKNERTLPGNLNSRTFMCVSLVNYGVCPIHPPTNAPKMYSELMLPSTPWFSEWPLSFWFSH